MLKNIKSENVIVVEPKNYSSSIVRTAHVKYETGKKSLQENLVSYVACEDQ